MSSAQYDVIVVGGGPGGYVTAIRAGQIGLKTALIEREHLGGICLNWGCIPTKSLLRSAEIFEYMKQASSFGLSAEGIGFDLQQIVARSRRIAKQLNGGVAQLLKKNKIKVYDGQAQLLGGGKLRIENNDKAVEESSATHIILATGARARDLPGLEADGKLVWTYKEAMTPKSLPKSILVIGAGAIGIEFASFYNSLGVDVTVVEAMPQILPVEDAGIAEFAAKAFAKQGIKILTNTEVTKLRKGRNELTAVLNRNEEQSEITVDRVISAVGVVGNHENLGLENTRVEVDIGLIDVEHLGTRTPTGQGLVDGFQLPVFLGVTAVQGGAGTPPYEPQPWQQSANCRGMNLDAIDLTNHQGQQLRTPAGTQVAIIIGRLLEQLRQRIAQLLGHGPRATATLRRLQTRLSIGRINGVKAE